MPGQKLANRPDGRYQCRYKGRYFYGRTQKEALSKRDEYITSIHQGYNPDYEKQSFDVYSHAWLEIYRSSCCTSMKRQYHGYLDYTSNFLGRKTDAR